MMERNNLCNEIERIVGKTMTTPRDFDQLTEAVFQRTRQRVSASTLKRLWGYLDNEVTPRRYTLDVLARFAGYADYEAYKNRDGSAESNLVLARRVTVAELSIGQCIKLTWPPDRVCTVEHQGEGRFVVVEAENTKLSVGDTFSCHLIIEGEPLFLDNLVHNGGQPTAYIAGRRHGVMFEEV